MKTAEEKQYDPWDDLYMAYLVINYIMLTFVSGVLGVMMMAVASLFMAEDLAIYAIPATMVISQIIIISGSIREHRFQKKRRRQNQGELYE